MALAGSYAGFATALLLCFAGVLRGDASDGLIVLEETRFHFGRVPCVALSKTDAMDCTLDRLRQALLVLSIGLWPFLHSFSR